MKKTTGLIAALLVSISLSACQEEGNTVTESSLVSSMQEQEEEQETTATIPESEPETVQRQILMTVNEQTYEITLDDNETANALYGMLPMEVTFEDYNSVEKIAYLSDDQQLPASENVKGHDPSPGDFCLYVPWGNLSLFYQDFEHSDDLVSLGQMESGIKEISMLSEDFTITLEPAEEAQAADSADAGTAQSGQAEGSVVYMTTEISSDGLQAVYDALKASPTGNVAVKISTGEPGSNYLRTELIGDLVQFLDAAIVECNTAYGGSRANTAMHYQVAEDHGYTAIADVDIMDEEGSMTLPVTGGDNLIENYVGSHFAEYDYYVVLSHFKGHAMAGYGGAIKNISIGMASADGKNHIHTAGQGGSMWSAPQDPFLESMAEAGKSVADALDGNILYINVMNRLSVDCDCDGNPAEPDMHDIGILASFDPVAVDQACIDLVYEAEDGGSLINRIESRNGLHTLEQAEAIGLGNRSYELISVDTE